MKNLFTIKWIFIVFLALAFVGAKNNKVYAEEDLTDCFLPETQITMADGSKKRIDQIKEGDSVRSFTKDEKFSPSKVEKVYSLQVKNYITLEAGNFKIGGTGDHPFFTDSKERQSKKYHGFRNLGMMRSGDEVYMQGGTAEHPSIQPVTVTSIGKIREAATVYNIHLSKGPETFLANGFAVHNY